MSLKLAMWSGPRNISTAMMRAWENRADTKVVDEPFYGYYLHASKAQHPMADVVLKSQATNWQQVSADMLVDDSHDIFYQKHMTHHMLNEIDLDWTKHLSHCFLIRDPLLVINSYLKKMPSVNNDDIGIERQFHLYQQISNITGQNIPIIDSEDVLQNPAAVLLALCQHLNIEFDRNMLRWPPGKRDSDGVWAKHWYQNVESSTGFAPYKEPKLHLTAAQKRLAKDNDVFYQQLYKKRIIAK